MKKYFLNRAIKKHIDKSRNAKRFVNLQGAKTALLLFECETTENNCIGEIIFQLSAMGMDVSAACFVNSQTAGEHLSCKTEFFGRKEINFLEKPKSEILQKFKNRSFDLLLDLTPAENLSLLYLSLFVDAAMKVSSHTAYSKIFDFIIDINKITGNSKAEDIPNFEHFLLERIIFYLKKIQTSD
jgi:hypothetical protein